MGLTYLHLAASVGITAISAEYPIVEQNGLVLIITALVMLGSLFILMRMRPGILKYALFLLFLIAAGQLLNPLVDRLEAKGVLRQVLILVSGVFLGMTALAFYDTKGRFIGMGPYLFAGLVGLIVAEVIGIVLGLTEAIGPKTFQSMNQVFAWIGSGLFTLYVAYDTQVMRKRALQKGTPDYVDASLGLYLDILNLFSNIGSLNN
jgi:modulator of FtsH protease